MNFELSDEQRLLAESAERYMRERYAFEERRQVIINGAHFSPRHWQQFAEMGWLALDIAEADGGLSGSSFDLTQLMEPLGAGLLLEPLVDTAVLCARIISASDNIGSRQRLLESIAAGETVMALAHQEQDSRNEFQVQLRTRARRAGDGWALSGQKHRVFHGGIAGSVLVSAILEDSDETALFVVDAAAAGITANTYELIDGSRAADLHLRDVQVTDAALLLRGEAVDQAIMAGLDRAILALCAASIGSMEAIMAMTADYLKTRVQYGRPLAQFQALQHRMAEMFVETDQARAMLFSAINAFESGNPLARRQALSGAKVFITRAHYFVASQGIQLHGGIGTTDEYAVGHHYKAAVMFEKRFGDNDFHLSCAASDLKQSIGGALNA
ncbi:MAG TPA: acyl-CoA dehydrogenase [Pseudomonas sp.]|jgi:alkylation response protein AidB-like acyl-CoA dehydrogenase